MENHINHYFYHIQKKIFGKQNRSFSSKYYKEYNWVEYSQNKDSVFCFYCRHFGTGSNKDEVFTKIGFHDWKKFLEKLSKHNKSSYHIFSMAKYQDYKATKKSGNVLQKFLVHVKTKLKKTETIFYLLLMQLFFWLSRA